MSNSLVAVKNVSTSRIKIHSSGIYITPGAVADVDSSDPVGAIALSDSRLVVLSVPVKSEPDPVPEPEVPSEPEQEEVKVEEPVEEPEETEPTDEEEPAPKKRTSTRSKES